MALEAMAADSGLAAIWLRTERLVLRPPALADEADLAALLADPAVARYLGDGEPRSRESARAMLERLVDHHDRYGYSFASVFEPRHGGYAGFAGLLHLNHLYGARSKEVEVGYALHPAVWGHGYATELVCAVVDWGFTHLEVPRLVAMVRSGNQSSRRVLEKCGFGEAGSARFEGIESVRYEFARERWQGGC